MVSNQTCVADQEAIDAVNREVAGCGVFVYGTAIEDRDVLGGLRVITTSDVFSDELLSFFDIGWAGWLCAFVTADSPNWFVGDNNFVDIFGANLAEAGGELIVNGSFGFAVFALESGFADAENRGEAVADGGGDFLSDDFVCFIEDVAAFGMADDNVVYEAADLGRGDLAGVGTIILPVTVLSGEFKLAAIDLERESLERNHARSEDSLDFANWLVAVRELVEIKAGFAWSEIHLPVCDDVSFACVVHRNP